MNTPAHMALGLAALGGRRRGDWAWLVAGAVLPDLLLFVAHFTQGELRALARDGVPVLNSVPLWAAGLALGWATRTRALTLVAAAALLHVMTDLPLHADDARPHLWPLSDAVFRSPVSFWDHDHHGRLFGVLEGVLFAACLAVIWRRQTGRAGQAATVAFGVAYAATFVHFAGHAFADAHWAVW